MKSFENTRFDVYLYIVAGDKLVRMEIKISGIVQGVGFRPFIHKLVKGYELMGWVKNTSAGVIIEVEGETETLNKFVSDIATRAPQLAVIEDIKTQTFIELINYTEFKIIKSTDKDSERFTLISPDVCVCDDCIKELFDSKDRRYKFPFINCTNCGPRFTIIEDIPYDREKTAMKSFELCEACSGEYAQIEDRRYHAQPDCCFTCGPELTFTDSKGNRLPWDPIELARKYILEGKIIAVKGLGGFHLACAIENQEVLDKLRLKKQRDEKPFAIMCKNIEIVEKWCNISNEEKALLQSYKRPIVLLEKKNKDLDSLSRDNNYLGVMLPYTPVHYLLFERELEAIVMTSGNISDTPIIYRNNEAFEELRGLVDGFLINNRDIHIRCDDSLMRIFQGKEYPLRRSRGYVPFPIKVKDNLDNILACGAEQKATFAVSRNQYVFLSQHIGDMKNIETFENYKELIMHFENMFDIRPSKIVCDLHPDYMSTEYALERGRIDKVPLHYVQHHHAHMASCMADNNLTGETIGVIWDGTGYGEDGEIWGGEILLGDFRGYKRMGSIRPIILPGGDKAVKEIYRLSYALLYDTFGYIPENFKITENANLIENIISNKVNSPKASSIGRLFDGVAALIGIKTTASYEGQGAIALEGASGTTGEKYAYGLHTEKELEIFDWRPMIKHIVKDLEDNIPRGTIAGKLMNTLGDMSKEILKSIIANRDIKQVVLSGGVFQNMYLLNKVKIELESIGLKVYVHNRVSTNDEGLALGQILIAQNGGSIKCV